MRGSDQSGIHHGDVLERQAFGFHNVIDGFQHLLGHFVFFQAVAWTLGFVKLQDVALIGQEGELFDLC